MEAGQSSTFWLKGFNPKTLENLTTRDITLTPESVGGQALKKAKQFEVQKVTRRQKDGGLEPAAAQKLALQLEAVKQLDLTDLSQQARNSSPCSPPCVGSRRPNVAGRCMRPTREFPLTFIVGDSQCAGDLHCQGARNVAIELQGYDGKCGEVNPEALQRRGARAAKGCPSLDRSSCSEGKA